MANSPSRSGKPTWGPWVSVVSVLTFFAGWELAYRLEWIDPLFFSAPSRILGVTPGIFTGEALRGDLGTTLGAYGTCILFATVAGLFLGLLTGASELAYRTLNPFIVSLNALPKIVLMPMVLLWFGMGFSAKIFLGTLMAGFPIIVNIQSGVRNLEKNHIMLARAFRASDAMVLRSIVLPSLVPYLLAGLRVGVTYAMVGILIVEFFASSAGIGYRMVLTSQNFQMDHFFVLLLLVVTIILTCTSLIGLAEKHFGRWRPADL